MSRGSRLFPRLFLTAVLAGVLGVLAADTIRLSNGNVVQGRIVEESDSTVTIKAGAVQTSIPRSLIESIERGLPVEALANEARRALRTARSLLDSGRREEALAAVDKAVADLEQELETVEENPEELMTLRDQLLQLRTRALPADETVTRAEQLYQEGIRHLDHLDYEDAYTTLSEATTLAPDRADIHKLLGDAARQLERYGPAITAYQRAIELEPQNYYSQVSGPLLQLLQLHGRQLISQGRARESLSAFQQVLLLQGDQEGIPVGLTQYEQRVEEEKARDDTLMEIYRYAENQDLVDLAFAAISEVALIRPADPEVRRLARRAAVVANFNSLIQAGEEENAILVLSRAPEGLVDDARTARLIQRLAGGSAPVVESAVLLEQARRAFARQEYREAADLASRVRSEYPGTRAAEEALNLLRLARFEGPIKRAVDRAEALMAEGDDRQAETELRTALALENISQSLHYGRINDLLAIIPLQKEADSLWNQAAASLDAEEYQTALQTLESLAREYAGTRAGNRAAKWLQDNRGRLDLEMRRYRPTDQDYFLALADPNAYRPPAADTSARSVQPVPVEAQTAARAAFRGIMEMDRPEIVEDRPVSSHVGAPLAAGAVLLLGVLLVFSPMGTETLREPDSRTSAERNLSMEDIRLPSGDSYPCRQCGLGMLDSALYCPHCGTPAFRSEEEDERAQDERRRADFDPWDVRVREYDLNRFQDFFSQAKDQVNSGQIHEAIASCRQALHEDPHNKEGYAMLADLYETLGDREPAEQCYREILLIDPTDTIVRQKLETAFETYPVKTLGPHLAIAFLLWWLIYWLGAGLSPGQWLLRAGVAGGGWLVTVLLLRVLQKHRRMNVAANRRGETDVHRPIPEKKLSLKEQNRQARLIARMIQEHTGIRVPVLSVWRLVFALVCSFILLGAMVSIAWSNHAPWVLIGWPAGFFLFLYLFEIHPRAYTAHIVLRHIYEETASPWADPHRPFLPKGGKEPIGEFLVRTPEDLPIRWAFRPRPYPMNRTGILNSLQQTLNRHWAFHSYYNDARVVRNMEIPMPAGFRVMGVLTMGLLLVAILGAFGIVGLRAQKARGYDEAMNQGFEALLNGELVQAEGFFEEAGELRPERAAPHLYWAHTEAAGGNAAQADRQFETALEHADDIAAIHNDYGNFLQRTDRLGEAIQQYRLALGIEPDNAHVLNNLGSAYFKQGNLVQAREALQHAISVNPQHPRAHTTLGMVYEALGQKDLARLSYEKAVRTAPDVGYTNLARNRLEEDLADPDESPLRLNLARIS